MNNPIELLVPNFQESAKHETDKQGAKNDSFKTTVKCLALDYDGTLSPIDAPRNYSWISDRKLSVLKEIGKKIPIIVTTRKDLEFMVPRTPFATAWSAVGGLETRIGNGTHTNCLSKSKMANVTKAIAFAKSCLNHSGVEIEEKFGADGCPLAFCVDWRHAQTAEETVCEADEVAAYCETLGLELVRSSQPFFEVYPRLPNKGKALKEILSELEVKDGVMCLGDSEADNTAFMVSNVSVGVIHGENDPRTLACDYLVTFDDVACFLDLILENQFLFDSDYFINQNKDIYMKTPLRNNEKRSGGDA